MYISASCGAPVSLLEAIHAKGLDYNCKYNVRLIFNLLCASRWKAVVWGIDIRLPLQYTDYTCFSELLTAQVILLHDSFSVLLYFRPFDGLYAILFLPMLSIDAAILVTSMNRVYQYLHCSVNSFPSGFCWAECSIIMKTLPPRCGCCIIVNA